MKTNFKDHKITNDWYASLDADQKKEADLILKHTQQHPHAHLEADEAEIESELALLKTRTSAKSVGFGFRKILLAAAAVCILAMGLGWIWYSTPLQLSAPYGDLVTADLPDGSTVQLNSGATISYSRLGFGSKNRNIQLTGEAYFDVKPSDIAFKVQTHNAIIDVLGTSFSVRAWDSDANKETTVYLEKGSLAFSSAGFPENNVLLEPGQASLINVLKPAPTEPKKVSGEHALAWRNKGLYYSSVPISVVLDDLKRRFNISIEVADVEILNEDLSLFMRSPESVEQVISAIAAERNLRFEQEDGKVILYAAH